MQDFKKEYMFIPHSPSTAGIICFYFKTDITSSRAWLKSGGTEMFGSVQASCRSCKHVATSSDLEISLIPTDKVHIIGYSPQQTLNYIINLWPPGKDTCIWLSQVTDRHIIRFAHFAAAELQMSEGKTDRSLRCLLIKSICSLLRRRQCAFTIAFWNRKKAKRARMILISTAIVEVR